jgi:hypothetical protein
MAFEVDFGKGSSSIVLYGATCLLYKNYTIVNDEKGVASMQMVPLSLFMINTQYDESIT